VWYVYGNRLLGRDELNKPTGLEALPFCTRSFAIKVKPHSCESISTYELKSQYSLSLGEYRMGRKPQLSTDVNAPQSSAVPPVPFETLRIEVVP
jgi:radical SAM superfamily enzyme with C-terminal helix-hairpin-helix motif